MPGLVDLRRGAFAPSRLPEIFDLLTRRFRPYTLNSNGTLITPAIARLLRRKGAKLIALYGATAEVHDRITRTPGSFAAVMQGWPTSGRPGRGSPSN